MAEEVTAGGGQYLTFKLSNEIYALEVPGIREVLENTAITPVPKTPHFLKGVINIRGGVVPVVDLRLKFLLPEAEATVDTCIIVVEVMLDNEKSLLGAVADQVQEVLEIDPETILPPPKIGTRLDTEFISGMAKHNDDFIIILDIPKVFSIHQLLKENQFRVHSEQSQEVLENV